MNYRLTKYTVSLVKDSAQMTSGSRRITGFADLPIEDMKLLDREQLRVYFLDARNNLIGWDVISHGSLTASIAHPREIFKGAILSNSAGIIMVHHHPSGEQDPSEEDIRLTQRIAQCGTLLGIQLLDHVVIAENGRYSFKASGRI